MSADCREALGWLDSAREDRLAANLRGRLQEHLSGCSGCRQEQIDTAPLPLFANLTSGPLPAGVENYILGGLRVEEERPEPVVWSAASIWPALASMAAAAALVVVWATSGHQGVTPAADIWLEAHAMDEAVATVEDIRSATAEVLALSLPEPAGGRTEVILIVDGSMDL